MPEQKCIICGNIVKFNRGQKVATCEYCETRQEYDGEVEPVAYEEPVMQATPSLERARRIRVEEARHTIKFESGGEPRFGATASSKSTIRFGEIDELEESEYPSEGYPKSGGFAKVFAILLLIALCASLIYIFYIAYKESTKKTPVYYANAYIDNPEWGQEIEVDSSYLTLM